MSEGYWVFATRGMRRFCGAAYWAGRVGTALFVAIPLARLLSAQLRHFPEGDTLLFEPGSILLLDVLRELQGSLRPVLTTLLVQGLCVLVLGSLMSWGLLVALTGKPEMSFDRLVLATLRAIPTQALLGVFALLSLLATALAAFLLLSLVASLVAGTVSERAADLLLFATAAPFLLGAILLRPCLDMARAISLTAKCRAVRALRLAVTLVVRHPAVLLQWAILCTVGWMLAALAGWLGSVFASAPGAANTAAMILVQQAGFLFLTLARLLWLSQTATRCAAINS
jgi:hypothetical protein